MGCGCSKFETVSDAPTVRQFIRQEVSVYAGMPTGTLAYFGPSVAQLVHVGVVLALPNLTGNSELLLLEYAFDQGLQDVLTGRSTDVGSVRLVRLDSRLRSLPDNWKVFYQQILSEGAGPSPTYPHCSESQLYELCKTLQASTAISDSASLAASVQASLGSFVPVSATPSIPALYKGRLLAQGYSLSMLLSPFQ